MYRYYNELATFLLCFAFFLKLVIKTMKKQLKYNESTKVQTLAASTTIDMIHCV